MSHRQRIGWREWVELPEWGLLLKAKIDTGAKSSSLDVEDIRLLSDDRIAFNIHRLRKTDKVTPVEADLVKTLKVRSSNGVTQDRYVVRTTMRLCGVEKSILITLASRRRMIHRMLLGREALSDDFLIDAGVDHIATPKKR
jgi:ribosomal protein S6--L-glutamate ligase